MHDAKLGRWRTKERCQLVQRLQAGGVQVWGSAAVYGGNAQWEGQAAAAMTMDLGLAGFIFDAEGIFDLQPKADTNAVKLLQSYRAGAPGKPAGWCWWPLHRARDGNVTFHPKGVLWAAMAKNYGDADVGLPMCYWNWGDSERAAVQFLEESWKQWREVIGEEKPLAPVGRAYFGNGGAPTLASGGGLRAARPGAGRGGGELVEPAARAGREPPAGAVGNVVRVRWVWRGGNAGRAGAELAAGD